MTFPAVPRDVVVELWLNNAWVDVSALGHVRAADGIRITRGRPNEAAQAQPSTCSLTLDNRSGNYSPRNPLSPYYGMLGRNTPIRVSVNLVKDTFSRTVADNWGQADTGHDWDHSWFSGGSVNDFDVAGGVGTHSVGAANSGRVTFLADENYRDIDVAVSVTFPYVDVAGGAVGSGIIVRGGPDEEYFADVWVGPAETVFVRLWIYDGAYTALTSSVQVTDFVYTGQQLRMRALIAGDQFLFKVWPAAGTEPYGWHIEAVPFTAPSAGWIGIQSDIYTSNTNTKPGVFAYDNLVVRSPRFAGEVAAWPQRWDTSGNDVTVAVEAASVLRRLAQGSAPQLSTLYRAITGLTTPAVAYWPCEDGSDSDSIASAVGGPAMVVTGETDFASYGGFAASYPIPVPRVVSTWSGTVPSYTATGELQLSFIVSVPDTGATDLTYYVEMTTQGGRTWSIQDMSGGALRLQLWEYSTLLFETPSVTFDVNGKDLRITLTLEQNGSHIDWELRTLEADSSGGGVYSGTQLNRTVGRALRVRAFPHGEMTGVAMGHISVRKEVTNFWDQSDELKAFSGEDTAVSRIDRLCEQNNVSAVIRNEAAIDSAIMGPQRPLELLALLQECADADRGTLCDARNVPSLLYRERASLYAQSAVATLDYSGQQIAPPFQPIDDDQLTRNDVTARRLNGGSARAVLETGRMSVLPPEDGGVGAYSTEVEVNVASDDQLPDIAGWELNKGAVDETRYPVVRVGLHYLAVSADAALSAAMLDLDVDDRFIIENPKDSETPDTIDQICLGYTEHIGVFEHSIAINAAPASPYRVAVFDDGESRRDTDGSDLTSSITTTATSFQVDVPSGVLWTTAAADMPIPIMVGGEEIAVGAVSGTSSPQMFSSVTRSVNGIVKAHSAGTALSVARPVILGL